MDVGFGYEEYGLQKLGVELALHHKSLGYAKLGSWDMHGASLHTICGDVRGQLCPGGMNHQHPKHWCWTEAVHDAIAEGETLRFRRWAMEETFGDRTTRTRDQLQLVTTNVLDTTRPLKWR